MQFKKEIKGTNNLLLKRTIESKNTMKQFIINLEVKEGFGSLGFNDLSELSSSSIAIYHTWNP